MMGLLVCARAQAKADHCLEVRKPLAAQSIPVSEAFALVSCPSGTQTAAFRYDKDQGVTRLSRDVQPGEITPLYPEFGMALVVPGQKLVLAVVAGAARVERPVTALQVARSGQRLFVRANDGQILTVRYGDHRP
jgi:hypothetical protein